MRTLRKKYKIKGSAVTKSISPRMFKIISTYRKDLQRKENIEYGRLARKVTFQYASQELADKINRRL